MKKQSHFLFARTLVTLMDTKYNFFGIRFGIDPILNVLPGGDFVGAGISCYLFWIAYELHVPPHIYIRMAWNILIDFILGYWSIVGVVLDLLYRANSKNLQLLVPFVNPEVLEGEVVE